MKGWEYLKRGSSCNSIQKRNSHSKLWYVAIVPSFGNLGGEMMNQTCFLLIQTRLPPSVCHISTQVGHKCVCLCFAAVSITRARFSGSDEFGYTSFVAYASLPSFTFFYEFKLQFTLANNSTAVKDNLVMFAGLKGRGESETRHLLRQSKIIRMAKWMIEWMKASRFYSPLSASNKHNSSKGFLANFEKWMSPPAVSN